MKKFVIFLYTAFLSLLTIFSYVFVDPNLSYLRNVYSSFAYSNRLLTTFLYISSIIIFFIFYGLFIYLGIKKKIGLKDLFILLGITIIVLLFSYPAMLSYDIFNYVATSKVLFFYHENPYIVMPIEFAGDPLLAFTHAANKIALYGPFWIILTGVPYLLGFGNFLVILFNFKILAILFYLGTILLIWKISKNIISLILFAFNPLIVIEILMSGHNDIVMIFLVILSYFFLKSKKVFLGILFFVLSIFIKYITILLVPILLFMLWKIFRKKDPDFKNIFYLSALSMLSGFFLSPIREEIYPWYAIWFLSFIFFVPQRRSLIYVSIAFSFGLMFRYVPFMFSGTYGGMTPLFKSIFTFGPVSLIIIYFIYKKLWEKISSR